MHQNREIFVITGLSGSGKSSVMRSLEDFGFYCVDNLPVPLMSTFVDLIFKSKTNFLKVALGIDVRGGLLEDFMSEIDSLKHRLDDDSKIKIIFLNASDETLVKRFQETRRTHPLARDISLTSAIKKERELLLPVEKMADEIHFTDRLNIHELRKWVSTLLGESAAKIVTVNLISFGFKYGVPVESNIICDLRFLPNPYFIPQLKRLTGKNEKVQKYLFQTGEVNEYWSKLIDFLNYSLQSYYKEGRFFANVAIGCTGGKHRSVAFVERIAAQRWKNIAFLSCHRDVGRE